ncbi:MAG: YabP/YqfC family sporulation protein [Oscillospiraceae bacterium]|nr:YabP/YqfC family sporulation protein [Oscillospiraceae bacterium]
MRQWIERLADSADLQGEAFPGQSVVELLGDRRVLIEHHGGVTEYSREKIVLRMKFGFLCVCGGCLELAKMDAAQLVITGRIDGVNLIRRR